MAKIVLSEEAPQGEAVTFSLGNESFEAPYETNNPVVLAGADAHPWLAVERDAEELDKVEAPEQHVKPEDDALSAQNSVAFDAEAVAAARAEAAEGVDNRLAVDPTLDQDDVVLSEGGIAKTLAADDAADDFKEDNE